MDAVETKAWRSEVIKLATAYDYAMQKDRLELYVDAISREYSLRLFQDSYYRILKDDDINKFPQIKQILICCYEEDAAQRKSAYDAEMRQQDLEDQPATPEQIEEMKRNLMAMLEKV